MNKELPKWLIKDYVEQHNNQWPFKQSGITMPGLLPHVDPDGLLEFSVVYG